MTSLRINKAWGALDSIRHFYLLLRRSFFFFFCLWIHSCLWLNHLDFDINQRRKQWMVLTLECSSLSSATCDVNTCHRSSMANLFPSLKLYTAGATKTLSLMYSCDYQSHGKNGRGGPAKIFVKQITRGPSWAAERSGSPVSTNAEQAWSCSSSMQIKVGHNFYVRLRKILSKS